MTGIAYTTTMNWVKESAQELSEDDSLEEPSVAEIDKLQTYISPKSNTNFPCVCYK